MTAQDVLRKAAGEIGYYAPADPNPGSKYGRWEAQRLGQPWLAGPSTSIWWCAIFTSWVYDGLADVPGEPGYNCDTILHAARAAGLVLADKHQAQPGDQVFFDWNHNGSMDHTGVVEINMGGYLQTIEGNTSGSNAGSQSAGNGVWRRTRDWSVVAAVVRPHFHPSPVPPPPPAPVKANCVAFQRAVRANPDNVWGPDTNKRWAAVRAASAYGGGKFPFGIAFAQSVVGVRQDNIWGNESKAAHDATVIAIQKAVGADPDGIVGPETDGKVNALHAASNHTV